MHRKINPTAKPLNSTQLHYDDNVLFCTLSGRSRTIKNRQFHAQTQRITFSWTSSYPTSASCNPQYPQNFPYTINLTLNLLLTCIHSALNSTTISQMPNRLRLFRKNPESTSFRIIARTNFILKHCSCAATRNRLMFYFNYPAFKPCKDEIKTSAAVP